MRQRKLLRSSIPISRHFIHRSRLSRDQIKHRFKKLVPVFLVVIFIFGFLRFLSIHKIICTYNNQTCPEEITKVTNRLNGVNSLFVNQKELISNIKSAYPADSVIIGFQLFNTYKITIQGQRTPIPADIYLVKDLPTLSMDQAPSSTDSAGFWIKPSSELKDYINSKEGLGFNLWDNGLMTPTATVDAKLSYIFSEKPDVETVKSLVKLIHLTSKYASITDIYVINNRCFLSQENEPDIIILVPFDEGIVAPALQSLSYLATIKKDAKVIDLSFKNPIIR